MQEKPLSRTVVYRKAYVNLSDLEMDGPQKHMSVLGSSPVDKEQEDYTIVGM